MCAFQPRHSFSAIPADLVMLNWFLIILTVVCVARTDCIILFKNYIGILGALIIPSFMRNSSRLSVYDNSTVTYVS